MKHYIVEYFRYVEFSEYKVTCFVSRATNDAKLHPGTSGTFG